MRFDPIRFGRAEFGGLRLIESKHAMVSPKDAISDDMRCMVEDLGRFGQIHKKPGAYSLPNGSMLIHPVMLAELNKRVVERAEARRHDILMRIL